MGKPEFPFTFESICQDHVEAKLKVFGAQSVEVNITKVMPGRVFMPKQYEEEAERIYNLGIRPDDIWIVTYPKCGTTWTQETMWQIVNFDFNSSLHHFERSPFLEVSCIMKSAPIPEKNIGQEEKATPQGPPPMHIIASIDFTENLKSPRVIKTHLPLELLPPKLLETCKVIYVCRNPKDTCVSYFHHTAIGREIYLMHGSFEDYAQLFKDGRLGYGDYWHHLKGAWAQRHHKNMKFIWYEDMKKDHKPMLRSICEFTGYKRSEKEIEVLAKHLTIDNMRKGAVKSAKDEEEKLFYTHFFRKGQVGDWKNYFEGEKLVEWDQWIQKSLEGTDIELPQA
eukprot:snap_masked-scaffold152_size304267-processed-gene-1.5 protein:Tk10107 transcript:snap_masked-scaffold152_size304267-processed-gene-1.5-mRNA-1 annotation:"hypothetical protein DAPPUDRAFT_49070"